MWINHWIAVATGGSVPPGAAAGVGAQAAAPTRQPRRGAGHWNWRWLWAWPFPLAVLALWQLSAVNGWVPDQVLPPPGVVFSTFADMAASGELWSHLSISLVRVFSGFGIGLAAGLLRARPRPRSPISPRRSRPSSTRSMRCSRPQTSSASALRLVMTACTCPT